MTDISLKYYLLSNTAKKEVSDFMDFLLSKQQTRKSNPLSVYKKKILSVSRWSSSDIKIFEDNQKSFNTWRAEEW
jgi:hypothetical protein